MRAFQAVGWNAALAALPSETHRSGAAFHIRGAIHRARGRQAATPAHTEVFRQTSSRAGSRFITPAAARRQCLCTTFSSPLPCVWLMPPTAPCSLPFLLL